MSKLVPITIGCAEYDRTRPLKDGRVSVEGCDISFLALGPEELFFRAFRYHEFDVAELSFNSYLMQTSRGICPYIAVSAFVSRQTFFAPSVAHSIGETSSHVNTALTLSSPIFCTFQVVCL